MAALFKMPVQLTPNLERPMISVLNFWRAAAPADLELEIIEPTEQVLQSINGVEELRSSVRPGLGITIIEFALETDMQQAFIDVVSALNQVPGRPREADEPVVNLGSLNGDSVANVSLLSDRQKQLQITFDPYKMAAFDSCLS